MLTGVVGGLFALAGAVLWSAAYGTANAWVLIVEVVRDERYRPIEVLRAEEQ